MKNRNRFVCILLTIVLILFSGSQVSFAANNKPRLSEMTDTALFDYMLDLGLIIPKGCDVPNDNIKMVKHYVCQLEDDRSSGYSGGMVCYRELFENVRAIVFNYYGWDIENDIFTNESFRYTLQHSTFYSSGNSNQNCYGYALGQYSNITPGYYAYGYNLSGSQLQSLSSLDLANRVKADLESSTFNQQCVYITLTRPNYSSGQTAMCIRKGSNDIDGSPDFHLMKLAPYGYWRHKVGVYAILTYNSLPQNTVYWTSEYATDALHAYPGTYTYDSTIYYIVYSYRHSYNKSLTGESYMDGVTLYREYEYTCSNCGETYCEWEAELHNQ